MTNKVLITSGATREYIDKIRYISNISSGSTGAIIAENFINADFEVTYLCGESSVKPKTNSDNITFRDFSNLDSILKELLSKNTYSAIIHLAAVSDYSVKEIIINDKSLPPDSLMKICSEDDIQLKLKNNHKIINNLKSYSNNSNPIIIGFKLTNEINHNNRCSAIFKLSTNPHIDYVVHNDFTEIENPDKHVFSIYKNKHMLITINSVKSLSQELLKIIKEGVL
jgi:phosphopantothenoylcysteine decarboxylase / phosphopantothenate---cysteine ligase